MCTLHLCLLPPCPSRSHQPSNCSTGGTAARCEVPGPACPQEHAVCCDCAVDPLRAAAAAAAGAAYSRANSGEAARRSCGAVEPLHDTVHADKQNRSLCYICTRVTMWQSVVTCGRRQPTRLLDASPGFAWLLSTGLLDACMHACCNCCHCVSWNLLLYYRKSEVGYPASMQGHGKRLAGVRFALGASADALNPGTASYL